MKIRLLLSLAGLAIGFALPTFAQQTNTPDPKLLDALVAFNKKFDDLMMNGDATAVAALFTDDACLVEPTLGPIYGREAIQKYFADVFQKVHFIKHMSKLEQYSPHIIGKAGYEVWTTGEWNVTLQVQNGAPIQARGHWLDIDVRERDAWKFRVNTWNAAEAPAAPAQTQ